MSTISSKATHRANADAIVQTLASTLKRWWVAYITWRMGNIAIAQLKEMSDRELDDIGLTRCDIARTQRLRTHTLLSLRNPRPENALLPSSYIGQLGGFGRRSDARTECAGRTGARAMFASSAGRACGGRGAEGR